MNAFLDHAFYAVIRPYDCLCAMCMAAKPCATCGKPSVLPIKAKTKLGYRPYCVKCGIKAAKKVGGAKPTRRRR
jgi:hypothetical protein